jgi:hypothetical protein
MGDVGFAIAAHIGRLQLFEFAVWVGCSLFTPCVDRIERGFQVGAQGDELGREVGHDRAPLWLLPIVQLCGISDARPLVTIAASGKRERKSKRTASALAAEVSGRGSAYALRHVSAFENSVPSLRCAGDGDG